MTSRKTPLLPIAFATLTTLWLLYSLTGCNPKQPELPEAPPSGIIAKDSMVMIMCEGFLAEGASKQIQQQHKNNVLAHTNVFYHLLFKKYGVTREAFQKSLAYYYQSPQTAMKMYEEVIENLNKMESTLHTEKGGSDTISSGRKQP